MTYPNEGVRGKINAVRLLLAEHLVLLEVRQDLTRGVVAKSGVNGLDPDRLRASAVGGGEPP